ncbi:LOW QUALITY PROTEIN: microtubule-associated protein 4 [Sphaeramia orbicularis]|uniref:LOW QUALITY PROTEIN: microtubule-associated protein 4 n=1 Tax=Sphaeramia orbicularis TaxID=375764 RepID=UPI00117DDD78|nr:LOW QUALITY PROTEIN: microtubule-associated protein 4-like [Sphaeramia orbicularis]
MAELDLSLSDALTDSVPQSGPESLVERDFVAQLEAETFEDQVGETVGKTDYIPLLDNDDTRAEAGTALENGEQEAQGVQKPGCKLTAGGQTSASRPEPQGEVRPHSLDQQQAFATDFLSASMASYSDPLGSHTSPAQMMDTGLMGAFSGFSQPGGIGLNVEVGAAPFSAEKPASIAEPQQVSPKSASDVPKDHSPMLPEPQAPRSPLDLSAGTLGDCWQDKASCLSSDLPFTPSVSTVISRHAGHLGTSPEDHPDSWPSRESAAYAGGDEREGDGSDRKQKKKKKRRQKDEGSYEHIESRGQPEAQVQGENTPPAEEFYHRIGPRRERGEGGWEEQLGKSGGRGKKGKSRKKLPEEWSVIAEPFIPSPAVTSQIPPEVLMDLGSSAQANPEASFADINKSPWKHETYPEEGLAPSPLSEDLFSPTIAPISPMVLNSELKATAAPFTMPSTINTSGLGSFSLAQQPDDPFDLLMDTENANLGNNVQALSPPFSPGNDERSSDMVDSGMFDNTASLQDSSVQGMLEGDTSAFSPASQPSISPKGEVLASAPPLSPSDASWLLNDSNISSNSELFEFSNMSTSGPPLPLGLAFDTPSPAPLRSPKTTAQEFQTREQKDAKSAQKQSKKSHSSSSSSSVKSPTSPGTKKFPSEASPVLSPSTPPTFTPLGVPGSGLNPAAKPFFPSFADPVEEPAVVSPAVPTIEVKSDKVEKDEKKEEKVEDTAKKVDMPSTIDKAEQKSVKVEFTSSETVTKVEKEVVNEKQNEIEKEKEKEVEKVKDQEQEKQKVKEEKEAEIVKEKEPEKLKEKETEAVELTLKAEKENKTNKNEEPLEKLEKMDKADKTEKVEDVKLPGKVENEVEKVENVEKMGKNEKPKEEEKVESKTLEKTEQTEGKYDKEQHVDSVEKIPEHQPTPIKQDTSHDQPEKKDNVETKVTVVEEPKKEEAHTDKAKETEKDKNVEKSPEKPALKEEKQSKAPAEKKTVEKKDEKKEKTTKADVGEKAKKAKPAINGSSATPSKDVSSVDKKTKPVAAPTKPSVTAKTRPNTAVASGGSAAASAKRPTPSSTITSTTDKKTPTAKAPSTSTAGSKRPLTTSTSRPSSSTTAARDVKAKTTAEKRPPVPKATSDQTGTTAATKNSTAAGTATRTTTTTRTAASTRTATTAAAKKPLASKMDSKPGEEKKPSTLKTSTADSTKPKTTTTTRVTASTTAASRTRTTATKPTTPSSASGTVPEKKPSVPRTSRPNPQPPLPPTASRTTARTGIAGAPDIRNARSKIGSTDNIKHQPGGGKVSSASQSRGVASKETSQGKVQIVSKKVDFSHVTSRLGSKENMKHVPGGGNVQILNKKVDLSKVTSKCGSKDNIKHKPGGGDVKIESHKVSFRDKAQSKVGSMDNVGHSPGGGNIKAEGDQRQQRGLEPLSGHPGPAPGLEPGQAGSSAAQENGLKEGAPCDSEGLREPQALDSLIPETKSWHQVGNHGNLKVRYCVDNVLNHGLGRGRNARWYGQIPALEKW